MVAGQSFHHPACGRSGQGDINHEEIRTRLMGQPNRVLIRMSQALHVNKRMLSKSRCESLA
jgi:hypothetical protein